MKEIILNEYSESPIKTIEQQKHIDRILRVRRIFMNHEQVGEILCLADEVSSEAYDEAIKFIQKVISFDDAERYKNYLIAQIIQNH